ncbi:MAG: hypothetical protein QOH06_1690 [Acidobacteriota bacterium]|jgi:signal transduction histidine kinase|nr:hypothetical protein [Acidobacteriota bacterium]
MNRLAISFWTLLLANAALGAVLGLGLAISPRTVLGLFPAAVAPGSAALLQAIGFLLFGLSLTLWTVVDIRRTDMLAQAAKFVACGLVCAWVALLLIAQGAVSPDWIIFPIVFLGLLLVCCGVFEIVKGKAGGPQSPDPAGEAAAQQERRRLARDLHDSIKQQLFSIKLSSAAAEERWESDPGGARAALADVRKSAHAAMVEMQAMLSQLRPQPLATAGLVEALREQCEALGYRCGIPVHFEIGDLPPDSRLPDSARETLFRIAQEALSNIARHARARTVHVQLGKAEHEGAPALLLQVRDDGQGFGPAGRSAGMGLRNMRERLEAVHGALEVRSAPGEGTEVRACAPLAPPKAPADPVRNLMAQAPFVMLLVFIMDKPNIAFALIALLALLPAGKRSARSATDVRLKLVGHQHWFLLLAMAFWWVCALVPNPVWPWVGRIDRAARLLSPLLLGLALREAWAFFRFRRSVDGPGPEPGLPVWLFALMLLALLASLPLLFLVPDPWVVARSGLLSYAILYLGWRLRA